MASTKRVASIASLCPESTRHCTVVVACWCLGIILLPPNGLLWQFGACDALGHWLVDGVLATLDLSGLVR